MAAILSIECSNPVRGLKTMLSWQHTFLLFHIAATQLEVCMPIGNLSFLVESEEVGEANLPRLAINAFA